MAVIDEENSFGAPPRKPLLLHEIGQAIDSLSIAELETRIAILKTEIDRLEGARDAKEATKRAADAFFRT